MSNQDQHGHFPTGNPWSDQPSQNPTGQQQQQFDGYYDAPPGPPPSHQSGGQHPPPPGQGPTRSGTFKESDFVPESQRGEQREAMQQFEMNKAGNESQQDRDVAQLQQEFPGIDGSLIAALYSDAGNMGATKEMLMELATQTQEGQQGGQQSGQQSGQQESLI
jgi:hypothetical protein